MSLFIITIHQFCNFQYSTTQLFEKAVHTKVYLCFPKCKKMSLKQLGFCTNHLTDNTFLLRRLRIYFVRGVFVHLQKTIGTADHQVLLKNLSETSNSGKDTNGLTNWKQFLSILRFISSIKIGVFGIYLSLTTLLDLSQ